MKNNSLCVLPFHHMDIQPNGLIKPCCEFDKETIPESINTDYKPDVFQSEFFKDIREKIARSEPVSGCKKCYFNESKEVASLRLEHLATFKKITQRDFEIPKESKLVYVNLAFSNTCNNKCRMCNSRFSTNWYEDEKQLGISIPKGIINQTSFLNSSDLSTLKFINLTGGEPLLEQHKIINLLEKCNLKDLTLVITTNLTLLPNDQLLHLLKTVKKVEWSLSIDAYGSLNDFLRKGSNWNLIENNLSWYHKNFENVKVNTVISIYNVNCYDNLVKYLKIRFPKIIQIHRLVDGPDWLSAKNLPEHIKDIIKEKNNSFKNIYNLDFCSIIQAEIDKKGDIKIFKDMDQKLNKIRNESWEEYNPELYKLIYD